MPGAGTLASPTIQVSIRPSTGHDTVIKIGQVRIKSTATIDAEDVDLRTIKSAIFTPYDSQPLGRPGGPPVLYGSVTVAGSLMNSVRVRSFRGSIVPHTGTQHVGTAAGGTMQASFFIAGA